MATNSKTAPIVQEKDKNSISLDLMHRMKMHGMAAAFQESIRSTVAESMTPDGFLSWLLARESTIITSQLPVSNWYDAVGAPTVADALLDRIVHTAHRIELTGESMRKIKGAKF